MVRPLVVTLTCGPEAPERANQAFTVATAARALGSPVSLWLTGEAVWFAVTGRQPDLGLDHATPVAELVAGLLAPGSTLQVCSQCAARRDLTEADLVAGARIAGAASMAAAALEPDAQAMVF